MLAAARHSAYSENRVGSYYRARYYDPNPGRFVSEDPIGSSAGLNFYAYVDNSPNLFDDPFGLWKNKGVPADPNKDTIVCDGQGGIRVQLDRNLQLLPERKECLGPCTVQHEEVHKRDALASNPKICKGSADGIQIGFSNDLEGDRSEIAAHKVGIQCIEDQLRHEKCEACRKLLKGQLALDQAYLKMFEFYLERDLHKSN
jgi:RHS repeat-associated protein